MGLCFSMIFYRRSYTENILVWMFLCQWIIRAALPCNCLSVLLIWLEGCISLWVIWEKGFGESKSEGKMDINGNKVILKPRKRNTSMKNLLTHRQSDLYMGTFYRMDSCSQCPVDQCVWDICACWIPHYTHDLRSPLALSNNSMLSKCKGLLKTMHIKQPWNFLFTKL